MVSLRLAWALFVLVACSPEARRERDGGPGGDPGNKELVRAVTPNPVVADTTLWPGRNPAPVERLAAGEMPPPVSAGTRAMTPATKSQQETYDKARTADPRQPSSTPGRP